MNEVDRLMREYVERYAAGRSADPSELLERVEGTDRAELETLIDAYLARAPRRRLAPDEAPSARAREVVESFGRALDGSAGLWPALLPRLREGARMPRRVLVARLAEALGVEGREEKVGDYYHRMEQGRLAAAGVSERVLAALGAIVGESSDALRRAGSALTPGAGELDEAAAFARTAFPDARYETAPDAAASPAPEPEGWDEVDTLFRGG